MKHPVHGLAVLGALVLLGACHGGGSGTPPAPAPGFTFTVAQTGLTIPAGGSGFVAVNLNRSGGFTGEVAFTVDGVPAGILVTGTVTGSAATGLVRVLVDRSVAPQTLETLKLKAVSGSLVVQVPFRLVIAPALPPGSLGTDLVQAGGGLQRAGTLENSGVAQEPVAAQATRDAAGTLEARGGFQPGVR